jgi:signal transduction histidine kinase
MASSSLESGAGSRFLPGFMLAEWHPALRYSMSVASIAAALILDKFFGRVLLANLSFIPLTAVIITALCAGFGPALLAVVLSLLGLEFFFWIPAHDVWDAVGIGVAYGLIASMIAYITATVRSLNRMLFQNAEELEKSIEERNELLSVLSQDFRTHVTSLRINQGVLRMLTQSIAPQPDQRIADRINVADRGISRLTNLIDNVVELSKRRDGRQIVNRGEVDLSELVREIADSLSTRRRSRRIAGSASTYNQPSADGTGFGWKEF